MAVAPATVESSRPSYDVFDVLESGDFMCLFDDAYGDTIPEVESRVTCDSATCDLWSTDSQACWFVNSTVNGICVRWLVDSGAAPNVLSFESYLRLGGDRVDLQQTRSSYLAANGGNLQVYGTTTLDVVMCGSAFCVDVVVADLMKMEGIIGMDFLVRNRLCLDCYEGTLHNGQCTIKLHRKTEASCSAVKVAETVKVHGRSGCLVKCSLVDSGMKCEDSIGMVEPVDDAKECYTLLWTPIIVHGDGDMILLLD